MRRKVHQRKAARDFLVQFEEWSADRTELSEREASEDHPLVTSNEWYDSDDVAVDLLYEAAELVKELQP